MLLYSERSRDIWPLVHFIGHGAHMDVLAKVSGPLHRGSFKSEEDPAEDEEEEEEDSFYDDDFFNDPDFENFDFSDFEEFEVYDEDAEGPELVEREKEEEAGHETNYDLKERKEMEKKERFLEDFLFGAKVREDNNLSKENYSFIAYTRYGL